MSPTIWKSVLAFWGCPRNRRLHIPLSICIDLPWCLWNEVDVCGSAHDQRHGQILTSASNLWSVVSCPGVFSNERIRRVLVMALFWTSNQISQRLCPRTVRDQSSSSQLLKTTVDKNIQNVFLHFHSPPTVFQQALHLQTAHVSLCNVSRAFSIPTRTENRWQERGEELWWCKTNHSCFKNSTIHSFSQLDIIRRRRSLGAHSCNFAESHGPPAEP